MGLIHVDLDLLILEPLFPVKALFAGNEEGGRTETCGNADPYFNDIIIDRTTGGGTPGGGLLFGAYRRKVHPLNQQDTKDRYHTSLHTILLYALFSPPVKQGGVLHP
ncbi:MAG: hypothetical protein LBF74_06750 [Treponema sp.]|jgi:hypothetical protein|nr:hypothetical protein [Treponema sp.]